jgi:hypothetical protein
MSATSTLSRSVKDKEFERRLLVAEEEFISSFLISNL